MESDPYQNEVGKNCKSYRLRYAGLKFFCAAVGDRAQDDVILIASSAALFWKTPETALEKSLTSEMISEMSLNCPLTSEMISEMISEKSLKSSPKILVFRGRNYLKNPVFHCRRWTEC